MTEKSEVLRTPIGLMSFPNLFTPKAVEAGKEARYSMTLIFDAAAQKSPEFAALKKAAGDAAKEKWPKGLPANIRSPFRDGAEKKFQGYGAGKVYINVWSKDRPGVVDHVPQEITVPADVWAGQLARVTVRVFAYDTSGNKGVSFYLNNVQITKSDMPRMDGKKDAMDEFGGVAPDDDIPF